MTERNEWQLLSLPMILERRISLHDYIHVHSLEQDQSATTIVDVAADVDVVVEMILAVVVPSVAVATGM